MRQFTRLIAFSALAALLSLPAPVRAQVNVPAHGWLFGAWTGGLFPPPSSLAAQECLAQPVVIFTRDLVMRVVITDQLYVQRLVETARVTGDGVEFRLVRPVPEASSNPFSPSAAGADDVGFGCISPDILHVQRLSPNQISFPDCKDFPYPLVRCPAS